MALRADLLRCPHRHGWKIDINSLKRRLYGVSIVPDICIIKVHNNTPFMFCSVCTQGVCYELWVYNIFCRKPSLKQQTCRMVRKILGLRLLDVVLLKWWFVEISPEKRELIHSAAVIRHTLVPGISSVHLTTRTSSLGLRTDHPYLGMC